MGTSAVKPMPLYGVRCQLYGVCDCTALYAAVLSYTTVQYNRTVGSPLKNPPSKTTALDARSGWLQDLQRSTNFGSNFQGEME